MKPSNLTRGVFRALIANQPYIPAECLKRQIHTRKFPRLPKKVYRHQRRTFIEALLGNTQSRLLEDSKATSRNVDRALSKLSDLVRARRQRARAPANEELVDAVKFLFKARVETHTPLTRTEVYVATETLRHLQERDMILTGDGAFNEQDLMMAMTALALPNPKDNFRSDVRTLGEMVHQIAASSSTSLQNNILPAYVTILAQTGSAMEAQSSLRGTFYESLTSHPDLWRNIMRGLLIEGRNQEFWTLIQDKSIPATIHEELVAMLASQDKIWDAERMFDVPISDGQPTSRCMRKMLEMTLRSGKTNLAEKLARQLSTRIEDDDALAALILWHAARSTSLDDLQHRVHQVLAESRSQLEMETLNNVIAYALKKNNPSLANTLLQLASSQGLHPNGKTYALRLQYALDHDDMDLAYRMYETSLVEDIPDDNSDLPILNKYAAKLAFMHEPDHNLLMRIIDTLLERGADLEVETVAGLCRVFLQRDELDEAQGVLKHRADLYPVPDRARIAAIFRDFILDPDVTEQRAYNAYEVYRFEFPETPVADRLPIMQSFFNRKRPDFACTVFSHMRQCDPGEPGRPDADAYTKCFEGIAQCRDVDGLQTVYNALKLDLQVELTTKVRNGLMLAYIACQLPWQAIIDHFYKIMDSREGPSYSTFEVAIRACETWPPYGSFEARKIIAVMQSWNLEITKSLYDNYVGVIAGQCEFENAVELIEEMEKDIGEAPDAFTIGTFYNAIPWQFRKDEVEKWAKQAYPELWEELLTYGEEIDEEFEVRYFKLDRSIDIDDEPLFDTGDWKPEITRQAQAAIEPLPLKV